MFEFSRTTIFKQKPQTFKLEAYVGVSGYYLLPSA